ncbi:acetylornithine transaminase [Phytoactinopolyspora mesophila]|uniref:Acetylornithine aminotransferase n=1 Tax=Phytoactinopolyspora mesophila TaxID=2650750 RepID=A0A7K3M250_9ACTN|nr:acetylornithine transaminase [Phytoactinopolyspora mesophila]NDL57363.1 acetylornithine transaminase [Phytoactinopolyspora mesophila]
MTTPANTSAQLAEVPGLSGSTESITNGEAWTQRYGQVLMNTFGTPQRVLVRGEGCYVWDADGRRYLDMLGGLAVNALGHAHPLLVSTVTAQLATLGHVSNFFASAPQVALAERLLELLDAGSDASHAGKVFFTNSGTEANEAAFKIARRTGRPKIVAAEGGFHGRTMGALALTGKPSIREPFEPMPAGVEHVPYGDVDALRNAVDTHTAAVILEPVQGEAGVRVAPPGYLAAAREITANHGALLILDEVQTGIGRTGQWFAHHTAQITPDVVTVAKGLGGGLPIGACIGLGAAGDLLGPGSHGTTFGGNPVAAAAGLAVLHAIDRDGLLANVRSVGRHLADGVHRLKHPLITGVRGSGLLLGIGLAEPVAPRFAAVALEAGLIVNPVAPDTVRLAPPLILTTAQADEFLTALPRLLDAARES